MAATANKSPKWFAVGFTRGKKIIADTRELQRGTGSSGVEQAVDSGGKRISFRREFRSSRSGFDPKSSTSFSLSFQRRKSVERNGGRFDIEGEKIAPIALNSSPSESHRAEFLSPFRFSG